MKISNCAMLLAFIGTVPAIAAADEFITRYACKNPNGSISVGLEPCYADQQQIDKSIINLTERDRIKNSKSYIPAAPKQPTPHEVNIGDNAKARVHNFNLVKIGMSASSVYTLLGKPERVNSDISASGTEEQLVYELGVSAEEADKELRMLLANQRNHDVSILAQARERGVSSAEYAVMQQEAKFMADTIESMARENLKSNRAYIYIKGGVVTHKQQSR